MDATNNHVVIDGNTAAALGCVYAGATVGAWYPITPSTSLMDAFSAFCRQYRSDPETGKRTYAIIQAEDELAAIGMVLGANWMGARAFTPTSGPGISLMNEFIGFAYYAEIPAVIFGCETVVAGRVGLKHEQVVGRVKNRVDRYIHVRGQQQISGIYQNAVNVVRISNDVDPVDIGIKSSSEIRKVHGR